MEIIVSNVSDYYWPVMAMLPAAASAGWEKASLELGHYALYWGSGEKLVVAECAPAHNLVREICARLGYGETVLTTPGGSGQNLFEKIVNDGPLMEKMGEMALKGADFLTWGLTPGMAGLAEKLGYGAGFAQSLWLHGVAGSKCGARALFAGSALDGEPLMPEGSIAENLAEAASEADRLLMDGGGAVVKSDMGASGWGMVILDDGRKGAPGILKRLKIAARAMPELKTGLLAVERYVPGKGGGLDSASVQCRLRGSGGWEALFMARHLRGRERRSGEGYGPTGAALGRGALPGPLRNALLRASSVVCEKLSELGYSGIAGLDFALENGERPRLVEINARRTTLTSGAQLARRLYGERWEESASIRFLEKGSFPARTLGGLGRELKNTLYPSVHSDGSEGGWLPLPLPGEKGREDSFSGAIAVARDPEETERIANLLGG